MDEVRFLEKVSLFSLLKREDLERIAEQVRSHTFQPREIIIREGDQDRRLFIVVTGRVDVVKDLGTMKERTLSTLGPHSYFGEMALIDDMSRSASVVAKEETHLLCLDHITFREEIKRYPAMTFELLSMLSRRVRAVEKAMISTLGRFLPICAHCKKIRNPSGAWIPIEHYIGDRSDTEFSHGICPECVEKYWRTPDE